MNRDRLVAMQSKMREKSAKCALLGTKLWEGPEPAGTSRDAEVDYRNMLGARHVSSGLYLIGSTKFMAYKIGSSADQPQKRINAVENSLWHHCDVKCAWFTAREKMLEREIHGHLGPSPRTKPHTEWYHLTKQELTDLILYIDKAVEGRV